LESKKIKQTGIYVYSYYQAKEVLLHSQNFDIKPYLYFKNYLFSKLGLGWIREISNLLHKEFKNTNFEIVLDCKKNPALAIICLSNDFFNIKLEKNHAFIKKIKSSKFKKKITINQKIEIIDLKKIKNCNRYMNRIYKKYKKNEDK
tara:strand:+ start:1255 stop:1692 length:438 start_codon:yes stop_codon:yes gene_type:complete